ncbi:MAG: hypothetical protein ACE5FN_08625 [Leptospirillia bacterium]
MSESVPEQGLTGRLPAGRGRLIQVALIALVVVLGGGSLGISGIQRVEQDNRFCNRCHIGGTPMHTEQYLQVTTGRGDSLAAGHAITVQDASGASRAMRCVDCHKGVSSAEYVRFQWVAFRDLMVYVAGNPVEPDTLSAPMPDANCTGCHATPGGAFHEFPAHQGEMLTLCTECHRVHLPGPGPARTDPEHSLTLCARCHPGLSTRVVRAAGMIPPES